MIEQSSQSSKVVLLAVVVAIFAVIIFVILTQSGLLDKKTSTNQTQPSATKDQSQAETAATPSSTPSIPIEEAQKQFQAIQDQANAGTLSSEEAQKQMDALGAQIAPPPLPADAQK